MTSPDNNKAFVRRHLGANPLEREAMLKDVNAKDMRDLLEKVIPSDILLKSPISLDDPLNEHQMLAKLEKMMEQNQLSASLIGMGYHDCFLPPVIQRCFFENPGWYTAYTPYQAEISQGRLELLLGYQQLILDLTGMECANASLLDEATAAAEAMLLSRRAVRSDAKTYFVDDTCFPQVKDVLITRAEHLGIELIFGDPWTEYANKAQDCFGVLVQYPGGTGEVRSLKDVAEVAHKHKTPLAVGADLLALILLESPGAQGADIVFGNSQRFGVPLGYGGPHAAFFAVKDEYKRQIPGRLIGVSHDSKGKRALRMALQTREQHIRRDKATSNICTAQVLLANIAFLYAAYHGPSGLQDIATGVHRRTRLAALGLERLGYAPVHANFFDTLLLKAGDAEYQRALTLGYNLRQVDSEHLGISINETTTLQDIEQIWSAFAGDKQAGDARALMDELGSAYALDSATLRSDEILTYPLFHENQTETSMMRYLRKLQQKDIGLDRSMIPLGSCTMKLNAAAEMMPVSWKSVNALHPFAPVEQTRGYAEFTADMAKMLRAITGFSEISFQPNSGAQGEYAGLIAIRTYHQSRGETQRDVCLIPSSSHGTNPASTIIAGMRVVIVGCDEKGNVSVDELKAKAAEHADNLAALMITYPSTHGVFEPKIREICDTIHAHGGQVYMDGANLNAMVAVARPIDFGADVCHINLHKTFCIPHGGGGPGMGPIGVAEHLAPFLPKHWAVDGDSQNCVAAAPYGSASILPISWAYIAMMGEDGLKQATEMALLNANYLMRKLSPHYPVLYTNEKGYCAHECIFDLRQLKKSSGITEEDIAKRLVDYNYHAPTMSFPVAGTLMVEPTESESLQELDRFCDAMISIRKEVEKVEKGEWPREDNPLVNAPHSLSDLYAEWKHPYTREDAFCPLPYLEEDKYICPVNRIDNVHGDRNLICSCLTPEEYES